MPKTILFMQRVSVFVLAVVLLAALCVLKQEKALEQAKKQAIATGQPQQVTSVDTNGVTTTTVVQLPHRDRKMPPS